MSNSYAKQVGERKECGTKQKQRKARLNGEEWIMTKKGKKRRGRMRDTTSRQLPLSFANGSERK